MENARYSSKMLIGSILAGIVYAVIGELIYQTLQNVLPGIVLITIYFMGLFLFIGFAIWVLGKLVYNRYYKPVEIKQWLLVALVMLVLSILFEFLYELQFSTKAESIDSYIFVIDNSGSMDETDPEGVRFQAMESMLKDKPDNFQYAIYTFADLTRLVRNMETKKNQEDYDYGINGGGTAILATLKHILSDIDREILKLDSGKTHIILLSDGYATDIGFFSKYRCISALKEYAKKGISISTVGMLNADVDLMNLIAAKTGGVFVNVDNIDDLENAMIKAGKTETESWNLLEYRNNLQADILYAIMRIVFVMILGAVIGLQKAIICEKFLDTSAVVNSSIIGSVLAGICIEVGMNGFGIYPTLIRLLVCVLISFTLLKEDFRGKTGVNAEVYRGV